MFSFFNKINKTTFFSGLFFPLGYYFHSYFEPAPIIDGLDWRIGYAILTILISFIPPEFKRFSKYSTLFLHYLTLFTALYLCYLNNLGLSYSIGLTIIVITVTYSEKSLNFIKIYFLSANIGALLAEYFTEDPLMNPILFFSIFCFVGFYTYKTRKEEIQLLEKIQNAYENKSTFLNHFSHEIRTPLNGIIPIVEILQKENNPEKIKEYLKALDISSKLLLNQVNDILDTAKIESGKLNIQSIIFDPITPAKETIAVFEAKAKEKNIALELISKGEKLLCKGDPYRISQILYNLINNAIKFNQNGKVVIELNIEIIKNYAKLKYSIIDNGIGIPKEKAKDLFKEFSQVNTPSFDRDKGTGLGLVISNKLVHLMGGELKFQSPPSYLFEKGSIFYFNLLLPISLNDNSENSKEIFNLKEKDLKVLLIEDNEINRVVLEGLLKSFNIEASSTNSGIRALNLIKDESFDIIFIDLELPDIHGLDLVEKIKSSKNIYCVATSGHSKIEMFDLAKKAGFNEYIEKPVNIESLKNIFHKQN